MTCHHGESTRVRVCEGGNACEGSDLEVQYCNRGPCGSKWKKCSAKYLTEPTANSRKKEGLSGPMAVFAQHYYIGLKEWNRTGAIATLTMGWKI